MHLAKKNLSSSLFDNLKINNDNSLDYIENKDNQILKEELKEIEEFYKNIRQETNIERSYNSRVDSENKFKQKGYDFFQNLSTTFSNQFGPIQDDYILGYGDEIILILQGV